MVQPISEGEDLLDGLLWALGGFGMSLSMAGIIGWISMYLDDEDRAARGDDDDGALVPPPRPLSPPRPPVPRAPGLPARRRRPDPRLQVAPRLDEEGSRGAGRGRGGDER